jgi:hypothetical protein
MMTHRLSFQISEALRRRMEDTVVECRTSLSELARVSVECYLDQLEREANGQ